MTQTAHNGGNSHLVSTMSTEELLAACPRASCTHEEALDASILLAFWAGVLLAMAAAIPSSALLSKKINKVPAVSFAFWLMLIIITFVFRGSSILNETIFSNVVLRGYRVASLLIVGCILMIFYTIYLFTEKRAVHNGLILVNKDANDDDQGNSLEQSSIGGNSSITSPYKAPQIGPAQLHQNVLSIERERANEAGELNSREADEGYLINIIAWLTIPLAVADSVYVFLPLLLETSGICEQKTEVHNATVASHDSHARSLDSAMTEAIINATAATINTKLPRICIRNLPVFYLGSILSAVQKLIQAGMIRYRMRGYVPNKDRRQQTIWFLKLMSVWNLFEWLDALLEVHSNLQRQRIDAAIHNAASIFVVAYDALVVDYRLLCATVFYEKAAALQITNASENEELHHVHRRRGRPFHGKENWFRLSAFILGPLTAVVPIVKIVNIGAINTTSFNLPTYAVDMILSVALDILVIICICVVLFLAKYNQLEIDAEEHEYTQFLIFIMGWIGLLFWGLYGGVAMILNNDLHNVSESPLLRYSTVKSFIHAISYGFQMAFFIHIPTNFYHYRRIIWYNFLFIYMAWLFISQFIAEIVDQETVSLDHQFQSSCKIPSILTLFFQIAHPLMVGFRFHMCLHASQAAIAIKYCTVKIARVRANSFHDITMKAVQHGRRITLGEANESDSVAIGLTLKDSDIDANQSESVAGDSSVNATAVQQPKNTESKTENKAKSRKDESTV